MQDLTFPPAKLSGGLEQIKFIEKKERNIILLTSCVLEESHACYAFYDCASKQGYFPLHIFHRGYSQMVF